MRLNRLDLIRYGRFNDAHIDFPRPANGNPDVTLIYGPNESGKSTAFTGFLELLFGMQVRSHPYAFRYERPDLLVGAELDIPGRGSMVLRRSSKAKQSLQDDQGRPVEEAILFGALHGLDQETYLERFCLNDEGLRSGGERIADAKGDLGQLLHAGVSGLTNMAKVLEDMEGLADKFHKKGGRSTILKEGKNRLSEINRALKAEILTPDKERSLRKARDDAEKAYEAANDGLTEARHRQAAGKAARIWHDQTQEMARIEEALSQYPDGPDLPKGAMERVAALVAMMAEKSQRIIEADETIRRHKEIIADNGADPLAPALVTELTKLDQLTLDGAPLTARAVTAQSDLAKRIGERDELSQQVSQILASLNIPDVPVTALVMESQELETLANAAQACLTTKAELQSAQTILQNARDQLGEAPSKPQDLSQLTASWNRYQAITDPSHLAQMVETERARLAKAVAGLPVTWPAQVEQGLPARETLQQVHQEWNSLVTAITAAQQDLEERETACSRAIAQRQADESAPSSIDMAETEETRRLREVAWSDHRGTLSDDSADVFEEAMRKDDGARTHYLMGTEARKQLETSRRQEADALALRDMAQRKLDNLKGRHRDLSSRITSLAIALGLPEGTGPDSFAERHTALMNAADIKADLANAERELDALVKKRQAALDDLTSAARSIDIIADETGLPSKISRALALQDNIAETWAKWERSAQAVTGYVDAVTKAEKEKHAAVTKLEVLTSSLPLVDRTPSGIKASLPHLRQLQQLYIDHDKLTGRIEALGRALETLSQGAAQIVSILDDDDVLNDVPHDLTGDDPVTIIDMARTRTANATRADEIRKAEEERLAQENHIRDHAISARDAAQSEIDHLFNDQEGDDFQPLDRATHLAERDALRADLTTADAQRREAQDGVSQDLFDEELAHLPSATREAELQQELDDAQDIRDKARDESVEQERLYKEAFDAADNSALVTEQATLLEELRSGARQAAISRLGALAARSALRRLASERRSTMLRDVEQAFVTMTAGEWKRVEVWSEVQGEKLVGIKPDGSAVPVEKMSTGTMGQLYFALRLAGYRSFVRDPGPLPMILDDIMETFDDARATAALNLCAEIGRSGQAIMFTHHKHLVTLAQKTIPGVTIVEMPG
ncbi:hypothetical protein FDK21_20200 [Cohaesibacter sp. CAU 1516]|uniref:AAA family ATPase n=1 Tax=Cohaesibacter sp. CAU 1516 TaxID=2576038 RepID=UPI0010FF00C1|nr:AAA family ATPase [Cohaesibacter sp. CAU 1516]TLP42156.1 hypothetical protein FDK21_20200 [Cohaesibacter sp. CAU 1516]